ncbi:TonB-dependent receptor [Ravibacter arvi]|uniref:TonB-dependent receptor n=2 Tax=Ravibacter arvi TaxID=2051041 RepID=A0ABP8MB53_9BACT
MKLIIAFLTLALVQAGATGYSQKVTLTGRNTSVESIFRTIEKQTGYVFFYDSADIRSKKISVNLREVSLAEALEKCFAELPLTYRIIGKTIAVRKKDKKTAGRAESTQLTELTAPATLPVQQALSPLQQELKALPLPAFRRISGKVTDENGESLPGVNILIKGTQQGTTTDADGNFRIDVQNEGNILVFSFVGYITQEVLAEGRSTLNITLETDNKALQEVVVVGYGTMKKNDLTGSIVTANLNAFKEAPNTNILQSIKGSIPGLTIGQTNQAGAEPSIQIRGRNTINGNAAVLIVLDGIIYNGRLGDINPADIESVNILKDASSKAIYGAQAANGVILITTRSKSKDKKPTITYTTYLATQTPTSRMRLRNAEEKKRIIRDIYYLKSYLGPDYTEPNPAWDFAQTELVPENLKGIENGTDFDWWNALSNPGFLTDHALSLNGATEKTSYYLSGGFTKQKGFLMNDNYRRNSIRINLSTAVTDWLTIGANTFGSFTNYSGIYPNMYAMKLTSPFVKPWDDQGDLVVYPTGATNIINPFLSAQADNKDIKNRFNGTFYGIVKLPFVEGLTYRLNYSNDYLVESYFNSNRYESNLTGFVTKNSQTRLDRTIDNILSYDNRFGDHGISATLVAGYRKNEFESTVGQGSNLSNLSLSYNSLQQATIQQIYSGAWKESFLYQMGRFNYNYRNTYLLTATLRRDGFSGFSQDNKFALFPSVGLAWVLSNHPFLEIPKVDLLKLRASYGLNGNMTSRYSSLARVTTADASKYVFGDGATSLGQSLTSLSNKNLQWEKTKGLNVGLDFGLLNNRIGGSIEYYSTTTTDLLWNIVIPQITGFSSIASNVGKIKNSGLEVILSATPVKSGNFEWNVNANFARNNNKIVSLLGEDKNKDGREDDLTGSNLFIGKSIGTVYHYQIQGIWQLNDEIMTGYYPGAYRVVDQDNDGKITADKDRVFLGRTEPAYSIGLQNEMIYKNFSFRFFINTIQGGKNGYLGENTPANVESTGNFANLNTFNYDLWSVSNPTGKYAVGWSVPQINPTPYYARNFVRLQDVSLAYDLGSAIVNKIGAKHLKVFASGKNLVTLTKWDGWDPETGQGINSDAYPVLKSFTLGLELSF